MRKLVLLTIVGVMAMAGTANAGLNNKDLTILGLRIAGLPNIEINAGVSAGPGNAFLTDNGSGGHSINDTKTLWSTVDLGPGTSLFTGVPLITDLRVTARNQAGIFLENFNPDLVTENGGGFGINYQCVPSTGVVCMGGYEKLSGQSVVYALGGAIQVPIDLSIIGFARGARATGVVLENQIVVTGGPWSTGAIQITNITTNLVTVPSLGNLQGVALTLGLGTATTVMNVTSGGNPVEVNTVTISGTNSLLSASKPGQVTLVSPLRIDTSALIGRLPGKASKTFNFVPEPGTLLLLVSGAVGLVAVGRRRMRK